VRFDSTIELHKNNFSSVNKLMQCPRCRATGFKVLSSLLPKFCLLNRRFIKPIAKILSALKIREIVINTRVIKNYATYSFAMPEFWEVASANTCLNVSPCWGTSSSKLSTTSTLGSKSRILSPSPALSDSSSCWALSDTFSGALTGALSGGGAAPSSAKTLHLRRYDNFRG
jgi:hypothetical protein